MTHRVESREFYIQIQRQQKQSYRAWVGCLKPQSLLSDALSPNKTMPTPRWPHLLICLEFFGCKNRKNRISEITTVLISQDSLSCLNKQFQKEGTIATCMYLHHSSYFFTRKPITCPYKRFQPALTSRFPTSRQTFHSLRREACPCCVR